jgi:hypothetical protein
MDYTEWDRKLIVGFLGSIINGATIVDTSPGTLSAIGIHKPALLLRRHQVSDTIDGLLLKDQLLLFLNFRGRGRNSRESLGHRGHSKDIRSRKLSNSSRGRDRSRSRETEEICHRSGRDGKRGRSSCRLTNQLLRGWCGCSGYCLRDRSRKREREGVSSCGRLSY